VHAIHPPAGIGVLFCGAKKRCLKAADRLRWDWRGAKNRFLKSGRLDTTSVDGIFLGPKDKCGPPFLMFQSAVVSITHADTLLPQNGANVLNSVSFIQILRPAAFDQKLDWNRPFFFNGQTFVWTGPDSFTKEALFSRRHKIVVLSK